MADGGGRRQRHWRWGLLTLLFLGIALTCLLVSNSAGHYTVVTGLGVLVGFVGAAYCTYRGIKSATWLPH